MAIESLSGTDDENRVVVSLLNMSQALSGSRACGYLHRFADLLAKNLVADYVLVLGIDDQQHGATLLATATSKGRSVADKDVADLPCAEIINARIVLCQEDAQRRFPSSRFIQNNNIEACLAMSITDINGDVRAILLLMSTQRITSTEHALSIMAFFSGRILTAVEHCQGGRAVETMSLHLETAGLLAGGVVHDFNNLLSTMTGFTTLAQRRAEATQDDKLITYLDEIHRAGLRGQDLVEQLAVMLRGQSTVGQKLNLAPMLKEIARYQRASLADTVEFCYEAANMLPDVVIAPVALYGVLRCLLAHATNVMPVHGKLTVSSKLADALSAPCVVCGDKPQGSFVTITISYSLADENAAQACLYTGATAGEASPSSMHGLHALGAHVQIDSPSPSTTHISLLIPPAA